jgi:hypothetical protein
MVLKQVLFLSFFLFLLPSASFAQEKMSITGKVFDTTGVVPLKNAVAQAVRVKDSLLLGYARTNIEGVFKLDKVLLDTFTLIISHPSFDDKFYYIFGNDETKDINIPSIVMSEQAQELDEVVIYAYKNPIYYKGDTLVYIADSFQVAENAVVEDLIKKLPGLEIDQDGKIKSQGKEINQVLVDGDEFFGSDPTIATKNLGAKGVKTVEVYEKKQSNGADGEEVIQVLDLRLKDDAKKGYFGRASGGTDFNKYYEGELLFNKFNKSQKISVFLLTANTPKSDFGFGDRNKFGLENEGRSSRFDNDGIFMANGNNQNVGVPQTLKAGVYYSDKIGKKKQTKIGFNYSYYNTSLNAISESRSQYYVTDSTFYSDDSTRAISNDETHRINLRFESQIDSLTSIEIRPKITFSSANNTNIDYSSWRDRNNDLSRMNVIENSTGSTSAALSNDLRLERKFMKKRRELNFRYSLDMTEDESDGILTNNNVFAGSGFVSSFNQKKDNLRKAQGHTGYLTYFEPLGKKWKLQFDYMYDYSINQQDRLTRDFDALTGMYTVTVDTLSNRFNNTREQNRVGSQIWYETRKHTFHGGAQVREVKIENIDLETGAIIPQNVKNVLPNFTYRFNPSQAKRMTVRYRTNSSQPSISDLQPIPDNTNPNRIRIGNANLLPNYVHSADISFNTYNAIKGRYIYVGGNGNLTQDGFGDSTTIGAFGTQISKTVNVDGNMYAVLYAGAGLPFWNRKFMVRPNFSSFISQTSSFLNGDKNTALTRNLSLNMSYDLNFDSLEINLRNGFVYNSPTNTLPAIRNQDYTTQTYYAGVKWTIRGGVILEANANYQMNGNRAAGYDANFLILNAAVTKKFLKTENLELTVLMNDILNQNVSAQRYVSANVVTDNLTRIISRYYLAKLTYRFNNRKAKEEDEKGWF